MHVNESQSLLIYVRKKNSVSGSLNASAWDRHVLRFVKGLHKVSLFNLFTQISEVNIKARNSLMTPTLCPQLSHVKIKKCPRL